MKKKLLIASLLASVGATAMAQSAFEGAYGQLGIGYENNSINSYTGTANGKYPVPINSASAGSFSGVVGLGYNFSVAPQFLLGLGADYGVVPSSTFNSSANNTTVTGNKVSNRYNIFLAPGYAIDKDRLVYLKAGYSSQSVKITDQSPGDTTIGQTLNSANANGYVLGLGYKQMIQGGFYGFAEGNYYSYSSLSSGTQTLSDGTKVTNVTPTSSAYQFLVGVGYKF